MWRWIPDERGGAQGLQVEDAVYQLAEVASREDKDALNDAVQIQTAAWQILNTARGSFITGTADYRDAHKQLQNLIPELFRARRAVEKVCADAYAYLTPGNAADVIKAHVPFDEQVSLVRDLVVSLKVKKAPAK